MQLPYNLDFSQRLVIKPSDKSWQPSPLPGVERIPFEREALESGRATSLVRYAPGSAFSPHTHSGGEEIFVLEGELRDEFGVYPQGTYLKNPIGSKHTPMSPLGCVLFVKLGHMSPDDQTRVCIHTTQSPWRQGHGGLQVMPLSQFGTEGTALVKWPAGERFQPHRHWGGEEIFVLRGEFCDEHDRYPKGSWLRSPHLSSHFPFVEEETLIWVKTGHLLF